MATETYFEALFRAFAYFHPPREEHPVPTINDTFLAATTDDATVSADQAKLSADTAQAVADHTALVSAVVANGPTLVRDGAGNLFALLPQPDGTVQTVSLKDGTVEPVPPPPAPAS